MFAIRQTILQRTGGQDQEPRRQQVDNLGRSRRRVVRGSTLVLRAAIDPNQSRYVTPNILGSRSTVGISALHPKIPLTERK